MIDKHHIDELEQTGHLERVLDLMQSLQGRIKEFNMQRRRNVASLNGFKTDIWHNVSKLIGAPLTGVLRDDLDMSVMLIKYRQIT